MFGFGKKRRGNEDPKAAMANMLSTGKFSVRREQRFAFRPVRLMRTVFILCTGLLIAIGLWGLWR